MCQHVLLVMQIKQAYNNNTDTTDIR